MNSRHRDDTLTLFLLSSSVFIVGGVGAGTLGVVWIYVQADFGVTLSALGVMLTVATIGRTITSTVSGSIIARFGIARVMMGGAAIGFFSQLGITLAPTWTAFIIAALGHGFGSGVMGVGLNAFAAVHFSARRMNWLHGSFGIGSTIGPFLVTVIVIDLGLDWRLIYGFFALTRIMMLLMFYLTRRQWRLNIDRNGAEKGAHASMRQTLSLPIVWLMVGAWMMSTGNELISGQFANSFLIEARSIEPKVAAAWVSAYWASLTFGRFFSGVIIARVSSGIYLRINNLCVMLGAALLWVNLSHSTSLLGLALIGFAIAPFAPLMASDTPGRVGNSHTANAMGIQFTGASLGMALLPWLGGALVEALGPGVIPQFVFIIALATFVLHEAVMRREFTHPLVKTS